MFSENQEFELIKDYIKQTDSEFRKPPKGANYKANSAEHLNYLKKSFTSKRKINLDVNEPNTITDDALWEFIQLKKSLTDEQVQEYSRYHKIAMSVEGKLGSILEFFIYGAIRKYNWIWCSGNIVKDTDFLKKTKDNQWIALQVKNSDNSENNASSRVRVGTNIIKWYRRFSRKKNQDNWNELCELVSKDDSLKTELNEEKYRQYIISKN
jgi:hypothetical protein